MPPALQLLSAKSMNQKKEGNGSLMVLYFSIGAVVYCCEIIHNFLEHLGMQ